MNKEELFKMPNVILYDDENIVYYKAGLLSYNCENDYTIYENLNGERTYFPNGATITLRTSSGEQTENIKLDDTLMKRIAKFNKEQECKRLDEEILNKKKAIIELDNMLKDKEKRWKKVQEYIANIYDLDLEDED